MATDTTKYAVEPESKTRHSALAEFSRDERRPAVLLLSALVIAVLFFGLGLLIGRWTVQRDPDHQGSASATSPSSSPAPTQQPASINNGNGTVSDPQRRFAILVATYDSADKTKPVITFLEEAGFKEIRATSPRTGEAPRYSILVGRYTQDEAREALRRMRATNDPRVGNAKVVGP